MAKRNLAQSYVYNGKFYGPGEDIEVPDEFAKELDARAEAEKAAQAEADKAAAAAVVIDEDEAEKPAARRPGDAPTKPVR